MKKTLAILLALVMVLAMVPAMAEGDNIEISTEQEFQNFINGINSSYAYEGKIITLRNDIDLSNVALEQNGSGNFAGTFDGNGCTIKNFSMTKPLFIAQITKTGIVKDLTIENVTLNNSEENARLGIVCRNNNGTMSNVHVKNCTIDSTVAVGVVGGLAAMTIDGCKVENCSVDGLYIGANSGATAIGGAFGLLQGGETTSISKVSVSNVNITTTTESKYEGAKSNEVIGGLCGINRINAEVSGTSAVTPDVTYIDAGVVVDGVPYKANAEGKIESSMLDFGTREVGYSAIAAKEVVITNNTEYEYTLSYNELSDYDVAVTVIHEDAVATRSVAEGIPDDDNTLGVGDKAIISINPKTGLSAGNHDADLKISRTNTDSGNTPDPATITVSLKFNVTAPASTSTGSGISLWYNGGNSFGSSKSAVPTSVEIDGTPVSFTGDGSSFTVSCVKADAKWITVRWNSTTVTTNFTPDARAACATVAIPKTGDMPIWAAIAEFFGF